MNDGISGLLNGLPSSEFGTAVRIIIVCAIIVMAGRAAVSFLFAPSDQAGPRNRRNSGYLAAAIGPAMLLFLTWGLRLFHLYTFDNIVAALLAVVTLGLATSKDFRSAFSGWRQPNFIPLIIYIGSAAAFWVLLSPEEYDESLVKDTSQYLIQGFPLFSDLDAGTFPLFGKMIVAPLLYAAHTISTTFALFSYGDHFLYYAFGEYWFNLLVGPVIPMGAYLFFRRFLSRWQGMLVTLLFCIAVLDFKIWNLRGELLAWILGFAFLILLFDFLSAVRRFPPLVWTARYVAGMSMMFFTLCLTLRCHDGDRRVYERRHHIAVPPCPDLI